MDDTIVMSNGLEINILTGCGPADLGWGTGCWIGKSQIFVCDWPDETAAEEGHKKICALLKAISEFRAEEIV